MSLVRANALLDSEAVFVRLSMVSHCSLSATLPWKVDVFSNVTFSPLMAFRSSTILALVQKEDLGIPQPIYVFFRTPLSWLFRVRCSTVKVQNGPSLRGIDIFFVGFLIVFDSSGSTQVVYFKKIVAPFFFYNNFFCRRLSYSYLYCVCVVVNRLSAFSLIRETLATGRFCNMRRDKLQHARRRTADRKQNVATPGG